MNIALNDTRFQQVTDIRQNLNKTNVCIALDWLALYFTAVPDMLANLGEGDTLALSDDLYLLGIEKPTKDFLKYCEIIYKKEPCGQLLYEPRSKLFFKPDTIKLEVANHALYSGEWIGIVDTLTAAGLQYKAASRIDIAIDGVQYLHHLLNIYAKQNLTDQFLRLKNCSTRRARFNAKVLNPKTMLFENFNIGVPGGNKMITIYNKSLEITISGKKYIAEYWGRNGVIDTHPDMAADAKFVKAEEKKHGECLRLRDEDIYRFELRLKSEAIKEIENFSIDMLKTKQGLASIIKTHCKNYFEMQLMDDSNVSRCTPVELLPYKQLEALTINKIARVEKGGEYKAKMTIHGAVMDIYKGYTNKYNTNEFIAVIIDRCIKYDLANYTANKLDEWQRKYSKSTDPEDINNVYIIISHLRNELASISRNEDAGALAARHHQAGATASFGE